MSHFGPLVRLGFAGDKGSLEAFEGALWLDCRFDLKDSTLGEERYLKGHIPGAIYAHLERDLSGRKTPQSGRHPLPSIDEMRARFEALGVSSDRPVIAYDDSDSAFAARAWWMLTFLGHSSVAVLDGGWEAYKKWGLPAETGRISPRPGALSVDIRSDLLITVDQVSSVPCLVDSRDPARFRGEQEPIDPVAGHIPHALNWFYKNNLDSQMYFKSSEELRRSMQKFFESNRVPSFYCGSGVTACVNVLACAIAGLPMPKLYAGSWSEWIRDPKRPVTKGV